MRFCLNMMSIAIFRLVLTSKIGNTSMNTINQDLKTSTWTLTPLLTFTAPTKIWASKIIMLIKILTMINSEVKSFSKIMMDIIHQLIKQKLASCIRKTYIICNIRFKMMRKGHTKTIIFQVLMDLHSWVVHLLGMYRRFFKEATPTKDLEVIFKLVQN